jgi:hypothetical protein
VREEGGRLLYIWISRDGLAEDQAQRTGLFRVNVAVLSDGAAPEFEAEFQSLNEALAYANGEGSGRVAAETRPVPIEEWPPDRPAGATLMVGRGGPNEGADGSEL